MTDINFRGLAIHNSSVWMGGSAGFVVRLKGEGQMHAQVEPAKEYELRDVAVFEEAEIVILGSGSKARYHIIIVRIRINFTSAGFFDT